MRDILADVDRFFREGESVVLATVIQTWGSAPRRVGAKMAVTSGRRISGSVSGGCVESAVVEASAEVLETGAPRLLSFGVADETAWGVGLACGGKIEVFQKTLEPETFERVKAAIDEERSVAVAMVVRGEDRLPGKELVVTEGRSRPERFGGELDDRALEEAQAALNEGDARRVWLPDGSEMFVDVILPSPTLIVVGGVHIAVALTSLAKTMGYRTVIVDPRGVFGSQERFAHADRVVSEWPAEALARTGVNRSTAIATLTHDPKLDDPALQAALRSPAFYIGALGSRRTQKKRRQRLLEAGLTETELARLHAPIGIDIGSQTPEEIALAIMAQVVAARNDKAAS